MSTRTSTPIELRSDNCAGVAPQILAALANADEGSALAYGGDRWTEELRDVVREAFQAPEAHVFPVASGTSANSLGLAALCPPWGSVLCHETAHIIRNECGATSMFGGGAVMRGLPGDDFKLQPASVQAAFDSTNWGDNHHSQPSVLSVTCPTDMGTVYTPDELLALADLAHERGLKVHLDGARLANAIAALHCSPTALTRDAGLAAFSLGAIKNGGMSCDAIVCFDEEAADQLHYRVKRAGHVASKMRYQSAQLVAYLSDGLWVKLARQANAAMSELARGLRDRGIELLADPQANMAFARMDEVVWRKWAERNVLFYDMGPDTVRLVTSWQTTPDDVVTALDALDVALG